MSSSPSEDGKQRKSQAAPNDSRFLTFPQKDAKRKRGKPTTASLNKGKVSVIHPRRTRPRLGNKSAKIHDNESDLTASLDGNAANEVSEIEIGNHEIHGVAGQESRETKGKVIVEDSETLKERWAVNPQEVGEGSIQSEWFDKAYGIELDGGNNARDSVKLEIMVDPVQSMLLDMIPSLGAKKVDSTDPVVEEGKPPEDNNAEPVKKKRVSYKDVASELLKDW
ncbi:hypothetical protein Acr_29g0010720 [Actinidia rufa]|uniref:Uncharacterized protein n=1 Tax=Actinidia rufa TaxID=165716 RepID=A0A7J0HFK2_9ERIC|nr:hypothetical protein Acr_29g0010720 [Actinidia rufa]